MDELDYMQEVINLCRKNGIRKTALATGYIREDGKFLSVPKTNSFKDIYIYLCGYGEGGCHG